MTTRPVASASSSKTPAGQFPEFPPRDDMQNMLHLHDQGHQSALRRHLGNPDRTVVIGEVSIGWNIHTRREVIRAPDLLVAMDVDRALVVAEMGYSIDEHGKPPETSRWNWHPPVLLAMTSRASELTTRGSGYGNTGGSTLQAAGGTSSRWRGTYWLMRITNPWRYTAWMATGIGGTARR